MYAAQNGKWPAALADVTDVPLPTDPMTGKPFEYRVTGEQGRLAAPASRRGSRMGRTL